MRVPQIALVLKGYPRLSETFIAQEIKALEEKGLSFLIVALRNPQEKLTHKIHEEIQSNVLYLPEYLHKEPLRVLKAWLKVRHLKGYGTLNRQLQKDLKIYPLREVIRRFGQACVMAAEMPLEIKHLYVHFIHSPGTVTFYASLLSHKTWSFSAHAKDIWTTPLEDLKNKIRASSWGVTCTGQGLDYLKKHEEKSFSKLHLVYHGLDLERFPIKTINYNEFFRNGMSSQKEIRLLSVGRMVLKKGFEDLIQVLARLPSSVYWRWTHIGTGPLEQSLKDQVKELNLQNKIDFRGAENHEEVMKAYRKADLFILPCKVSADGDRDGIPNVLMEAQSQGVACLSTVLPSIEELILQGETGSLFKPCDNQDFQEKLEALIQNPEIRYKLAVNAQERLLNEFTPHKGIDFLYGKLQDL
jgi:glycosyltransferase involved in cell wall biosynthesis